MKTESDAVVVVVVIDADNTLYPTSRAAKAGYKALYVYLSERIGIPATRLKEEHARIIRRIRKSKNPAMRSKEHSVRLLLSRVLHHHRNRGKSENWETAQTLADESVRVFWNAVVRELKAAPSSRKVVERLLRDGFCLVIASDEFLKPLRMKLEKTLGKKMMDSRGVKMLITPERTGAMKPSSKYCTMAFRAFNNEVPHDNFVFVGDSWERDLRFAKELGARTVLIGDAIEGRPDFFVKNLRNLPQTLKKMFRTH